MRFIGTVTTLFFLAVSHGANTFFCRCLPWGVNLFNDNFYLHPASIPRINFSWSIIRAKLSPFPIPLRKWGNLGLVWISVIRFVC